MVARFLKVRLAHRAFDGNFAKQRNFVIAQARGEWVFFIDGDELPGPNLVRLLPWLSRESWRGTEPVFRSGDALRERIRMYLPRL